MSADSQLMELTDFVKAVRERKDRQTSAQRAVAHARKKAELREQFRPTVPPPAKPVKLRF